ncbi:MAG TPA: sugar ABC transporter permease [Clostridiales bacterium]|nr:sugar ABC transporter permease [Clostridiales bacterium]
MEKKVLKKRLLKAARRDKYLYLLFFPVFVYYIVFCYLPIPGVVLAFKEFKLGSGIYGGSWIGLDNFKLFFSSVYSYRIIRNTILLSVYTLLFGFPIPILFAVAVTQIRHKNFRRFVQTCSYLPHFISTVVLVGIMKNFFAVDSSGLVNNIIIKLGGTRINFFMDPSWFRTLYVGSGIWQGFGFSSIIYISAIAGIDPSLYESAQVDGITKFKEVWYITLPSIIPTIIILFILQLGRIMSVGFEKVFLMYNPAMYETSDIISTFVYRRGIENSDYSYSTAVGLFNSLINFTLVFGSNALCRRLTNTSLW